MYHGAYVDVREQYCRVGSVLPQFDAFRGSKSGCQASWQIPLFAKPCHWFKKNVLKQRRQEAQLRCLFRTQCEGMQEVENRHKRKRSGHAGDLEDVCSLGRENWQQSTAEGVGHIELPLLVSYLYPVPDAPSLHFLPVVRTIVFGF